jgi:hypothetical protein
MFGFSTLKQVQDASMFVPFERQIPLMVGSILTGPGPASFEAM